uniref:Protein kinase domain-containing protein n=1 Tax=Leersia perrieri TaxID=77586 RepID=A0A0D9VSX8_9ORYZ
MERPKLLLLLVVFLVAVSWPLCSAGTQGFGVGAERSSSIGVSSDWWSEPRCTSSSIKWTSSFSLRTSFCSFTLATGILTEKLTVTISKNHGTQISSTQSSIQNPSTIAGIAAFLIISAAGAFYCRAKKMGTVRPWATGLSGQLQKAFVTGVPALKRSELETACEDFSNIIGSTSSCTLYKGTLSSGVEIAVASSLVTSANDWSKECESQYRKKITRLSKVSHKNFMNLLGYCEDEQPFTRVMVFEYAPNGTLFEYLHVREAEKLDWMTRLRISMGIAYCLEHMHQLKPPVVPRNFDSTTIYLTDDFAAKVSDLEFWNGAKEPNPTNSNSSSSSDLENTVRKYGMVLLEMLTGRVPDSEEDGPLERLASCFCNGEMPLMELIDPSIGSFSEEAACSLCEVVRSCIDPDPKRRPTMAEVAARMREITALGPDGATPKVSPLWWAELEIMSSES